MSKIMSLPPRLTDKDLPPEPPARVKDMPATEEPEAYSTLEVHHGQPSKLGGRPMSEGDKITDDNQDSHWGRYIEADKHAAPIYRPSSADGKIVSYDYDSHKEALTSEIETPFSIPTDVKEGEAQRSDDSHQIRILGLRRKVFYIMLAALLVVLIGAAVGGGVGGAAASRSKDSIAIGTSAPAATNTTATASYTNTGLAAMQWTDPNGTLYKRIYYQDADNQIREFAWDNMTNVKNVYYMSPEGELTERQAQANDSQAWEDDNFTGLFSGTNSTFLQAYWGQNIYNESEELVVLFQRDDFDNGLTQARYISANLTSEPWVSNNFPFAQPLGANFAMSLVSYRSGKHLMLYTIGDDNKVGQYEYSINDDEPVDSALVVSLTSQSTTPLTIDPRAPLAIVAQDNQPLYTDYGLTLPSCYQETPLTNLIMFATPDRSSLVMNVWNCTAGFQDHTSEIQPLQKLNTTFLALAAMSDRATGDGNVYLMFDNGTGPQVEEWTVPRRAGDPWVVSRKVDVNFLM
ncbi:hypothetical protein LTR36_006157 [Oleoguttula mirabilis]|uniref:Fucose-specific lectin n=1 Tax=Oleoguttula mirabilis TaxID=1507867 RepID=A0AAV9JCD2_9PEZI|nr:hypothetical protein LTR36_006157 [Oleoguttula mirabilis]